MAAEKIAIDPDNDCPTCHARHKQLMHDLARVKMTSIGPAECQECGREFNLMVCSEDVDVDDEAISKSLGLDEC